MTRKIVNLLVLIVLTAIFWYIDLVLNTSNSNKLLQTAITLVAIYLLFKVLLEGALVARLKEYKIRYSFRKGISIVYMITFLITFISIWIENVQALFVAYGLVAAGVAISLQDFFKNLAGGIVLLAGGIYSVGDRVEIEGKIGDVIDVGLLYTTILEIQNWVSGDQTTGRLTVVPNGNVLSAAIHNYTKDNTIVWDEIMIPVTYQSNWMKAEAALLRIAQEETEKIKELAEKEIAKLSGKYYLSKREASPSLYLKLTDNWIEFRLRYVTDARERRVNQHAISEKILKLIEKESDIQLASQTLDIVGFPGNKHN